MRTTVTFDKDVVALLTRENRRANEPMKQTINRLLRAGFSSLEAPVAPKRFVVKPLGLGTAAQWDRWKDMSAQEILDDLDGEFRP